MDDTYHNNEDKSKFDWNQIVTKSVETSDGEELGMVDGLEDFDFVVKDGLTDPKYYRIPRDKVKTYENGKVRLALSEEQVRSRFERSNPGYYRRLSDNGEPMTDADTGRTSNTIR
jgi:hypothetical protein